MDVLSKNLFNDFEEESTMIMTPNMKRPHTPTNVTNRSRRMCLPPICENSSPRSSDSFMCDDFNSTDEMMSPPCSPAKLPYSPDRSSFMHSPPSIDRGFLALKLFDTPHTPKTLLSKFKQVGRDSKLSPEGSPRNLNKSCSRVRLKDRFARVKDLQVDRKKAKTDPRSGKPVVYANINPFTPSHSVIKPKRPRQDFERYFSF